MSRIDYRHTIGGKGVAQGLPLRRGSHLYDVEPWIRYPNVLSLGTTQASQHQYGKGVFHVVPNLPITFIIDPYVSNHEAGGTFTRRQYYVIKRGQPLMAASKRQKTIGVFTDDGSGTAQVEDRTYVDPAKLGTNGRIQGFYKEDVYQLKDAENAGSDAELVISKADFNSLPATDSAGSPDQDDYKEITEDDPVTLERLAKISDEKKEGFRATYDRLEDQNDEIATGGVNMYAKVDDALFGETDMVKHVSIDADNYFFGTSSQSQGFLFPSTGGCDRTIFFNETDQEAGVTLPSDGDGSDLDIVKPIGNVTDVAADNVNAWKDAAVHVPALPTIGLAHTDIEQSNSHQYHHFATGTPAEGPKSVVKTGELNIPFVDLSTLKDIIDNRTELTFGADPANADAFNVTDTTGGRSGIKTGVYGSTDVSVVNEASLLTQNDGGYANLYYNFAAPFLVANRMPKMRDNVKPDLFANYTLAESGIMKPGASAGAGSNAFDLDQDAIDANADGNVDMRGLGIENQVVGSVKQVYDMPRKTLEQLRVNTIWQNRIIQNGDERNYLNEGYRRMGGTAETAGVQQILSDFTFMLLGGANYDHFSKILPKVDGVPQDISQFLEELILQGAVGMIEVAFNTVD